ncbi:hypothetical protein F4827_002353 [Paraburkholderia bannensis]|uniref:Uncharacterized protein n=1 Tax=Paraburkholderia bannensis TaxID=765414 RepID=A0A7W9TXH7_9BURK|nr:MULTISPECIES: hypothetical protein [Paraburkholderia]MBB3257488.1 hypothetical protein [Paraburkholderia sp. WP4_3_2]MBB6102501.1 hypothetical protein [Paraburkholderia bannensis]
MVHKTGGEAASIPPTFSDPARAPEQCGEDATACHRHSKNSGCDFQENSAGRRKFSRIQIGNNANGECERIKAVIALRNPLAMKALCKFMIKINQLAHFAFRVFTMLQRGTQRKKFQGG